MPNQLLGLLFFILLPFRGEAAFQQKPDENRGETQQHPLDPEVCGLSSAFSQTEAAQYLYALDCLQRAFDRFQTAKDSASMAAAIANTAYILKALQGDNQVQDFYNQALSLLPEHPLQDVPLSTWFHLAAVADTLPRGQYFRDAGMQFATQQKDTFFLARFLHLQGVAALDNKDIGGADTLMQQGLLLARASLDTMLMGKIAANLASIALQQNNISEGRSYLNICRNLYGSKPILAVQPDVLQAELQFYQAVGDRQNSKIIAEKIDSFAIQLKKDQFQAIMDLSTNARVQATLSWENNLLEAQLLAQKKRQLLRYAVLGCLLVCTLTLYRILSKFLQANKERQQTLQVLFDQYREEYLVSLQQHEPAIQQPQNAPLENALYKLFTEKKIYLDPTLKVNQVAKELGIGYDTLNQLLKDTQKGNFNQMVNGFRIEHAKNLLSDTGQEHLTIEGVALSSGFGSKQQFYNTFQQFVGIKPNEFRKFMHNNKGS
ncbi:MAG: helix-turn-helix transcriptional regulator [Saprospiraceae bacterium]|nr:helix-turn-helix transcriptional regulator [Saprospiraceae bacterium]